MKSPLYLMAAGAILAAHPSSARDTDSQIKQKIIKESIASYHGNCPCPYNSASNGSKCGGRSAWSRPGGSSPKCFEDDVSAQEVAAYRRAHGG